AVPKRTRLQHAARRNYVRHTTRARQPAGGPFRYVPDSVDMTEVGIGERRRQRTPQPRAKQAARERDRRVMHGGAFVLTALRRARRKIGRTVRGSRHDFDAAAGALQPAAQAEDAPRRAAVAERRSEVRGHVNDAHGLTMSGTDEPAPVLPLRT